MDGSQDFGVAACHACSDAPLEGLEMGQDGRRLQHRQQEAEDLQPGADVGDVSLGSLLLRGEDNECVDKEESQRGRADHMRAVNTSG